MPNRRRRKERGIRGNPHESGRGKLMSFWAESTGKKNTVNKRKAGRKECGDLDARGATTPDPNQ